jgi:hypothetical protein
MKLIHANGDDREENGLAYTNIETAQFRYAEQAITI